MESNDWKTSLEFLVGALILLNTMVYQVGSCHMHTVNATLEAKRISNEECWVGELGHLRCLPTKEKGE